MTPTAATILGVLTLTSIAMFALGLNVQAFYLLALVGLFLLTAVVLSLNMILLHVTNMFVDIERVSESQDEFTS